MKKAFSQIDRKEQTKGKLIKAVGKVLGKVGFKGLGVNKIAKEAGVDKVLLYRYFGGLPGLIGEYSRTKDFWPTAEELIGPNRDRIRKMPPDKQVAEFFKAFIAALRKRPVTQDILAWELLERNEFTKQLEDIRIKTILEYFEYLDDIPDDENLLAIVVLMGGAVFHLLVKSRINSFVGGIDLESEQGWDKISKGIDLLLTGIFKR
ncbi:MAG: TetR/AcrR family transcriptional regulator [Desulfobacteraceae bacterium]|nr:TetR/AcrR family transcriptional regulator [Desulfobacteraceae bacterium]